MDDFAAMKIGSAGMAVQRARIQIIAQNLANQQTTGPDGPYQRKQVIFESIPLAGFESELGTALDELLTAAEIESLQSVSVSQIVDDASEPILRYLPDHPHADADGNVAYPNISVIREMTDLMEAHRSYEANMAVTKTIREMLTRAIDVLG